SDQDWRGSQRFRYWLVYLCNCYYSKARHWSRSANRRTHMRRALRDAAVVPLRQRIQMLSKWGSASRIDTLAGALSCELRGVEIMAKFPVALSMALPTFCSTEGIAL